MNSSRLEDLLQQLETRLIRLEHLAEGVRNELKGKDDLPQKDVHLEMLERTLLRLIQQWQITIRHAISAADLYADQKGPFYIQLEFVLGHARGLSRDFAVDTSWFSSNNKLKRLISDVSMTALAALLCVHGIPVSEISDLVYDDETGAENPSQEGSHTPRLREGIFWQGYGHHDQHAQNATQSL